MKPTIVPFVKWVGGKSKLIKKISTKLPSKYNVYHEPFLGGGALFFYLQPKKAFISDLNKDLINAYATIKTSYKKLREYLILMEYGHSEKFFKMIRAIDRNDKDDLKRLNMKDSSLLRAARLIYLNKAGFNGMYRVNSQGEFNVPSGKKEEGKLKTHDYPNIKYISDFLKNNEITIKSWYFGKVLDNAKKGDFVYFDPPYDYEKGIQGFTSYQKEGFGTSGQKELAHVCKELDKKGVMFMVSNHNTKLINVLYEGFNIDVFKVKRLIGGKGAAREYVEEVLITNYENKK